MKVTNNGNEPRTLSHAGKDHPLMPGASVEVELTADEAKALREYFTIEGKPVERAEKPVDDEPEQDTKKGKKS